MSVPDEATTTTKTDKNDKGKNPIVEDEDVHDNSDSSEDESDPELAEALRISRKNKLQENIKSSENTFATKSEMSTLSMRVDSLESKFTDITGKLDEILQLLKGKKVVTPEGIEKRDSGVQTEKEINTDAAHPVCWDLIPWSYQHNDDQTIDKDEGKHEKLMENDENVLKGTNDDDKIIDNPKEAAKCFQNFKTNDGEEVFLYANSEKALNINEQRATIVALAEDNPDMSEEEYMRLQLKRYNELQAGEGQEDSGRGKGRGRGRGRGQKQIKQNESNEEPVCSDLISYQQNDDQTTDKDKGENEKLPENDENVLRGTNDDDKIIDNPEEAAKYFQKFKTNDGEEVFMYANSEKALNINEQRATIIAKAEDNPELSEEEYRRLQQERYNELQAGEGQEDSGKGKGRGRGRGRERGRGQKQIEENESNKETSTTIKIATQENPIP
ncbi:hypothetical protein ACET3Z_021288 [Daucus carota]